MGPDHYHPLLMMSKTKTKKKTNTRHRERQKQRQRQRERQRQSLSKSVTFSLFKKYHPTHFLILSFSSYGAAATVMKKTSCIDPRRVCKCLSGCYNGTTTAKDLNCSPGRIQRPRFRSPPATAKQIQRKIQTNTDKYK